MDLPGFQPILSYLRWDEGNNEKILLIQLKLKATPVDLYEAIAENNNSSSVIEIFYKGILPAFDTADKLFIGGIAATDLKSSNVSNSLGGESSRLFDLTCSIMPQFSSNCREVNDLSALIREKQDKDNLIETSANSIPGAASIRPGSKSLSWLYGSMSYEAVTGKPLIPDNLSCDFNKMTQLKLDLQNDHVTKQILFETMTKGKAGQDKTIVNISRLVIYGILCEEPMSPPSITSALNDIIDDRLEFVGKYNTLAQFVETSCKQSQERLPEDYNKIRSIVKSFNKLLSGNKTDKNMRALLKSLRKICNMQARLALYEALIAQAIKQQPFQAFDYTNIPPYLKYNA